MNGRDLPRGHGFPPLRALVPGHWGEVQVKWLTEIEFLGTRRRRLLGETRLARHGPRLDRRQTVGRQRPRRRPETGRRPRIRRDARRLESGGVDRRRGLLERGRTLERLPGDTVEQSSTSSQAQSGNDVWRQWAYEYDPPGSSHEVVVRAIEADGTVQSSARNEAYPNGATGWVSTTIS